MLFSEHKFTLRIEKLYSLSILCLIVLSLVKMVFLDLGNTPWMGRKEGEREGIDGGVGKEEGEGNRKDAWTHVGFHSWQRAKQGFAKHQQSSEHIRSVMLCS